MARPREFEEAAVLAEAVSVFWEHGFDHATVQDIAARTGFKVGSLYAAFGSKHDLYLRIVDHYIETVSRQVIRRLTDPPSGMAAIGAYFTALAEGIVDGDRRWGCLITNTVIAQAGADPEVAAGTEVAGKAAFLTCVVPGLNVLAKTRPSRERVRAIIDAALTTLEK